MVRNIIRLYQRAYVGLPREIWMLSGALFINRCGTMVLPFFTLYLTSRLGFTEAAAGWLLSAYGLGSVAGSFVGGRLTSRIGAIPVQILFLLLSVPMFLLVPFFGSWWSIAPTMFLLSFFSDGIRPANGTAITQLTPPPLRIRAFGLQRMALNLGISFGPAIGGVLATISFVWLFIVDGATTLLCAIVLILFFGLRHPQPSDGSQTDEHHQATRHASPLTDRLFVVFLGLILGTSIIFFQFHVTYPLYLTDHYGLTKPEIGLIYAVNTVVIVVFEMLLLNAIRRWPLLPTIGCGALLSCVGFGILPFGSSAGYCVFSMLVITLGEMLWMPLATGWISHRSDRGDRGMYMGWYTMTYSVAVIIAPTVGGTIYQSHRNLVWYLSVAVGGCVAIGFLALHRAKCAEQESASSALSPPPDALLRLSEAPAGQATSPGP